MGNRRDLDIASARDEQWGVGILFMGIVLGLITGIFWREVARFLGVIL